MTTAYLIDWLSLLVRWLHVVTGVAWIGASFYFVWLDNHLQPPVEPADDERGVGGEVWSVHGGGFYHAQKYRVAPPELPPTLHWFKWEAYSTWLSGMALLGLIYWYSAAIYLVDPTVAVLSPAAAILISILFIAGGWLIYDTLCRSSIGRRQTLLTTLLVLLVALAAYALCNLFSGRGAYLVYGAMLGTIMVGNVFFVIIPGQKAMVKAKREGELPDPIHGLNGKQRSLHNTFFTLPVLFVMVSNHYAVTYGHSYNWLLLLGITLAGALIRVWFVARHKGQARIWQPLLAVAVLAAVAAASVPRGTGTTGAALSEQALATQVERILARHCSGCHAARPTLAGIASAPKGILLETRSQITAQAELIHRQTVVTRVMPLGNLTGMTEAERQLIDRWYRTTRP